MAKPSMYINLNIKKSDIEKMHRRMRKVEGDLVEAAKVSVYRFSVRMMRRSKKYTPIDTGTLRDAAYATIPKENRKSLSASAGYGDVAYAEEVHENLTYHHPIGQAKFFERAVNEFRSDYTRFLQRNMRPMIRSGIIPKIIPVNDIRSSSIRFAKTYTAAYYEDISTGYMGRKLQEKRFSSIGLGRSGLKGSRIRTKGGGSKDRASKPHGGWIRW